MNSISFLKDIKRTVENLIITEKEYNEYISTLHLEPQQPFDGISSDEEKKEKLIYYRSLLEQYKKTMHTLKTQRKNLDNQLEEHEKYKVQLQQNYESTFQKYKESSDKAVDTILPHFMRPFGRWAKKFLRKYPKVGEPIYFGIIFGSLAVIMTVPVLRSLYSLAFLTGIFSEVFYAMKGKFFFQEFAQNKSQTDQSEKHLEQILDQIAQLAAVDALACKNAMLNKIGLECAKNNIDQCQDSIHKLLESDSALDDKTKEKSEQVTDTSTRDDTKEVSHESSHPKVLQKSISKPKQSDKEST